MKKLFRILSLALACAVAFSALSVSMILGSAAAPSVSAGYIRLEAETFGIANCYSNSAFANANLSGGIGVSGMVLTDANCLPKYNDLTTMIDKTATPMVTYSVNVSAAGDYVIKPGYFVKNAGSAAYVSIVVNDKLSYKSDFVAKGTGFDANVNNSQLTVTLDKGVNIIRVLPLVYEIKDKANGGNDFYMDYLDIEAKNNAEGIAPDTVMLHAGKATYYGGYDDPHGADGLYTQYVSTHYGEPSPDDDRTIAELTVDNVTDYSYFCYTVEVPRDGYYDMTFLHTADNGIDPQDQYFGAVINGVTHAFKYSTDCGTFGHTKRANVSAYLKAGNNVLAFTAQLPLSRKGGDYSFTNIDGIEISGGAKIADIQAHPTGVIRVEAEEYAIHNYTRIEGPSSAYNNNGYALADGVYNFDAQYTEEDLKNGAYAGQPYAMYEVIAPEDGKYEIAVGYYFGHSSSWGPLPAGMTPFIYAVVNNEKAYKCANTGVLVEVELKKGSNIIACGIPPQEVYDALGGSFWVNHDYLQVPAELIAVKPRTGAEEDPTKYTRYEAENVAFASGYSYSFSSGSMEGLTHVYGSKAMSANELKTKTLDAQNMPYVTYYINAEEAGDYDIRIGLRYQLGGDNPVAPANGKAQVGVFVNGALEMHDVAIDSIVATPCTITDTVTLKKGMNRIIVTGATSDSTSADGKSLIIIDQDFIDIDKSLSLLANQNIVEAEDSEIFGYTSYDGDRVGGEPVINVVDNAVTLDKLNADLNNLSYIGYIQYTIIAPEDGVYPVEIRSFYGGNNEKDAPFFAMSFNESPFTKVNLPQSSGMWMENTVELEMVKGANILMVTCALKDLVADDRSYLYWIDHDYISLPEGLTGQIKVEVPKGAGADLKGTGDARIEVDPDRKVSEKVVYVTEEVEVEVEIEVEVDDDGNIIENTTTDNNNVQDTVVDTTQPEAPVTGDDMLLVIPALCLVAGVAGVAFAYFKKRAVR